MKPRHVRYDNPYLLSPRHQDGYTNGALTNETKRDPHSLARVY